MNKKKECKDKECKPCIIKEKFSKFKETKFGAFITKYPEVVVGPLMILWVFILIVIATRGLGLLTDIPGDFRVAIKLGSIKINWYAIFILTGIIFAAIYGYYEFPRIGISRDTLTDGLLIIVPLSIIGARLFYVIFDPNGSYNSFIDVIDLTHGGLAIAGGIIVAVISVIIFGKIKKINPWYILDILAIGLLIGQIIGRWGNFINQEAHGLEVVNSWVFNNLVPNFVKINMNIGGTTYHPTFLYESFLNFVLVAFLIVIRRFRVLKVGDGIGIYLIYYGLMRGLVIEPLRTDQLYIGSLKVNIWMMITLFAAGGVILLVLKYILAKDLPYYYDLAITDNLYTKGLEGREYKNKQKQKEKQEKAKRAKAEQERYQVSDEEIIAELNKMEQERNEKDKK